jgi:hypothetical protein
MERRPVRGEVLNEGTCLKRVRMPLKRTGGLACIGISIIGCVTDHSSQLAARTRLYVFIVITNPLNITNDECYIG